ncbi:MAG: efflux RND transporter permease subunit [Candidatus Latescibacteria bacterium]|nr:efflux RND transporter permease subunit [Candidatus Latescibacterota bacterium]
MKLTRLAIERPTFIVVIFAALGVLGLYSWTQLGVDLLPDIDIPTVMVSTVYPGAGPKEIETSVSQPLEEAVVSINKVKHVRSFTSEGVSLVLVEFQMSADIDEATAEVQRKVDASRYRLPKEVDPPIISKVSINDLPILRLSMTGTLPPRELYQLAKDQIKPAFERLEGVGKVALVGGEEREIRVEVDPDRLQAYHLSILQVSQALARENLDFPTGKVDTRQREYIVRLSGRLQRLEDMEHLALATTPAGTIYLKDVATVHDGVKEDQAQSRLNARPSIGILIQKQSGANSVQLSDRVRAELARLEQAYPGQIHLEIAQDTSIFTRNSIKGLERNIAEAILGVSLVLLLFLHSWRNSLIVLLAIPTSLISTFIVMYALDFSLNLMSLMGVALTIGILVDDSIVVLENIHRHLAKGEPPREAALKGRTEIGFAAVAITLVDVVVFLPVALLTGIVGDIFREFALVIVSATLMSLFVSFTLTPLLASRWTKLENLEGSRALAARFSRWWEGRMARLNQAYHRLLQWALAHRKSVLGVSTLTLVGSLALIPLHLVSTEFMKQVDRGEFAIALEMPAGTALEKTNAAVGQVEQLLARTAEVERYFTTVGTSEEGILNSQADHLGQIQVRLVDKASGRRPTSEVIDELKAAVARIPGLKARVNFIGIFGTSDDTPIFIEVKGLDMAQLATVAAQVEARVAKVDGAVDIKSSWEEGKPEVRIELDREKTAQLGLTLAEVAQALRTAFAGDVATKYREGDTEIDTRVILQGARRSRAEEVGRMVFLNHQGVPVELRQIARIYEGQGPVKIQRKNRERLITIQANLSDRPLGDVLRDLRASLAELQLPKGTSIFFAGDAEMQEETFTKMFFALGLGIAFVYLIMVALFNSYLHPFTIMFSLPVAVVGALGALALTGEALNMFSMIGVIMLVGLVTKNAILLVDYTNTLREQGRGLREALLEAGPTRLRPILMTTLTLVLGMTPLALSLGPGNEMRAGMAVVLIGGLLTSTLLTLVLVPVVYTLVEEMRVKVPALLGRVSPAGQPVPRPDR